MNMTEDDVRKYLPWPKTSAGRWNMILDLLNPVDEDGNPLPPLISRETALLLLETTETKTPPG